jgi:hypothetical protein
MNDQVQQPVEQPIDVWNNKFAALMQEARTEGLFAPDVLFIMQRATVEIQHNINALLFTHEHKVNEEEGE